jgi:hypothetical protein
MRCLNGSSFSGVPSDWVQANYASIHLLLEEGLKRSGGEWSADDIMAAICRTEMQLWAAYRDSGEAYALCVTQIVVYPQKKSCLIRLCVGKGMDDWMQFLEKIEEWARAMGCVQIEMRGRKGWEKTMKNLGYDRVHIAMRKPL